MAENKTKPTKKGRPAKNKPAVTEKPIQVELPGDQGITDARGLSPIEQDTQEPLDGYEDIEVSSSTDELGPGSRSKQKKAGLPKKSQ